MHGKIRCVYVGGILVAIWSWCYINEREKSDAEARMLEVTDDILTRDKSDYLYAIVFVGDIGYYRDVSEHGVELCKNAGLKTHCYANRKNGFLKKIKVGRC